MKQLKKGLDLRAIETKLAFQFCEYLEKYFTIDKKTLDNEMALSEFYRWFNINVKEDVDLPRIEKTIYKILGYNGYHNYLSYIQDNGKERFKSEIKYKINNNHGLKFLNMVAYLKNAMDTNEAMGLIKKHYSDILHFGRLNIIEACDSLVSETRENIHQNARERLINDFYGYDENSIEIISINGLDTNDINSIEHKININILKDKIKKHL